MLSESSYSPTYIDACRARIDELVGAYREVAAASDGQAIDSLAPLFFNNLVFVLDGCFANRGRAIEGKDGNPINEVRMLCTSLLHHGGRMAADTAIRINPDTTVLKLRIGDPISITESQFRQLAEAYFYEIERRIAAAA